MVLLSGSHFRTTRDRHLCLLVFSEEDGSDRGWGWGWRSPETLRRPLQSPEPGPKGRVETQSDPKSPDGEGSRDPERPPGFRTLVPEPTTGGGVDEVPRDPWTPLRGPLRPPDPVKTPSKSGNTE